MSILGTRVLRRGNSSRATQLRTRIDGTATPINSLGAKGIGESGTIGATPAVQNATVDALTPYGIRHLDLPLTPERIWRALRDANT